MTAIRIGSRKSDLARLQAMLVGDLIKKKGFEVEYVFREAPGDINLSNPLWQMPHVGVFTSFLHEYLVRGDVDVVVHSWKDLPIDPTPGTEVVSTLPREDPRDLLLVRKDSRLTDLAVLTSSPRRQHNLKDFLLKAVPGVGSVSFFDVRGNIQTRMDKLCNPQRQVATGANALIVAKAAVDRFLSAAAPDFQVARETVRNTLEACDWAVLPLSINPTAAAQGALALEISSTACEDVRRVISDLNHADTFSDCALERATLKKMGGGCHQKIGCTVLTRNFGKIFSVRGLQPDGVEIADFEFLGERANYPASGVDKIGCVGGQSGAGFFERKSLDLEISRLKQRLHSADPPALFVAKADALPLNLEIPKSVPVWTAGVESWLRLAARGVWVNGCSDRLGEADGAFSREIESLLDRPRNWLKLTHDKAPSSGWMEVLPTYTLQDLEISRIDLTGLTHVYWSSGSAFEAAVEMNPEICSRLIHGCGTGHTLEAISRRVPAERILVALCFDEFKRKCLSH